MNVLRFFFSTAQGTQAQMLAINTSFFYTKSRQAGGGRERRVREKQRRLFHDLLKKHIPFKEVHLGPFHSENPWQSRQKRRLKESVNFVGFRDICLLKTT